VRAKRHSFMMGAGMYKYLFVFILFCAPTFLLADNAALQSMVNAGVLYRMQLLRGFYKGSSLHYDVAGAPVFTPKSGEWMRDAPILPLVVTVNGKNLHVAARRLNLVVTPECYDYTFAGVVEIDIALHEGESDAELARALNAVFINRHSEWATALPVDQQPTARLFTELWREIPPQMPKTSESSTPKPFADFLHDAVAQDDAAAHAKHNKSQAIEISGSVAQGGLIKKITPSYTAEARQMGMQGHITVSAVIGKNGEITSMRVTKAMGLGLNLAAVKALKDWRYKPYMVNGELVEAYTTITLNYSLTGQ